MREQREAAFEQPDTVPFFREAGAGSGVVCLHANASASGQWRSLMERLAPEFHVIAADTFGAGQSPPWPVDRRIQLRDEVALLEPAFAHARDPFSLVGHSYGGAVALIAAATWPHRVSALVLYEPTLFAIVDAATPPPNDADGIKAVVAEALTALDLGHPGRAAEIFIDFWMGAGAWTSTPPARQALISAAIANVGGWASALMEEPTPLSALGQLDVSVLLMRGSESPASSLAVARLLADALPLVEVVDFEGVGHMGPVTDPERINDAIADFLHRTLSNGDRADAVPPGPAH